METRSSFGVLVGVGLLIAWVLLGTFGFAWIEGWDAIDALYMTVITISTVGYGEVHDLSPGGRLFASFLIVAGLGTAVYTFTRLGQVVLEGELLTMLGRRRMRTELGKMEGHFILCGFGRVGRPAAEALNREKVPFCVIDRDPGLEPEMRDSGYFWVLGDATDEDILQEAGIDRAQVLLALLPSDADNLYLTVTAKSLSPEISVIARADGEKSDVKLQRGGADRVVGLHQMAANRIVTAALKPTVVEFMDLVSRSEHLSLNLEEFTVAERSPLVGRSLIDSQVRQKYEVIVVAIKHQSGGMEFNPDPDRVVQAGDVLIVIGRGGEIRGLERACAGSV